MKRATGCFLDLFFNWLIVAQSRYGKSELIRLLMMNYWISLGWPVVWIDPPGTTVRKIVLDMAFAGRLDDVIWVGLRDTDRNVGFDWIEPFYHEDFEERRQENQRRRDSFIKKLLARMKVQDTTMTPLVEEWLQPALDCMFWQETPVPDYWVLEIFDTDSAAHNYLVAHCQNQRVVAKLSELRRMSPTRRMEVTDPARRRLNGFFGKASVERHTGASFDYGGALDGGKVILVSGRGVESDEFCTMASCLIQRTRDHCVAGAKLPVQIVCDEATRYADLTMAESYREDMKYGCFYKLLFQNPLDFASDQIRNEFFGNSYHAYGHLGSFDAAEYCGKELGTYLLNPDAIHYIETRLQQVHDGFVYEDAVSFTIGDEHTSRTVRRERVPVFTQRGQEIEHRKRYDDQVREVVQKLMQLGRGYWYFRDEQVTGEPVYVPMLPDRFPSYPSHARDEIDNAITRIKQRQEYRKFTRIDPPCIPTTESEPTRQPASQTPKKGGTAQRLTGKRNERT